MYRNLEPMTMAAKAALFLLAVTLAAVPVAAQVITGTPGSPSATVTIDGKQIPPPPMSWHRGANDGCNGRTPRS